MTIPAYRYGDPAKVLEREEEQTCKGCLHLDRLWGAEFCGLGVAQGKGNMRRCIKFTGDSTHGQNGTARY
jgi:hypothetical protein